MAVKCLGWLMTNIAYLKSLAQIHWDRKTGCSYKPSLPCKHLFTTRSLLTPGHPTFNTSSKGINPLELVHQRFKHFGCWILIQLDSEKHHESNRLATPLPNCHLVLCDNDVPFCSTLFFFISCSCQKPKIEIQTIFHLVFICSPKEG
jgi:hypothetical protein